MERVGRGNLNDNCQMGMVPRFGAKSPRCHNAVSGPKMAILGHFNSYEKNTFESWGSLGNVRETCTLEADKTRLGTSWGLRIGPQ